MAVGGCNFDLTRNQLDQRSVELKLGVIFGDCKGYPVEHQLEQIERQRIITGFGNVRNCRVF